MNLRYSRTSFLKYAFYKFNNAFCPPDDHPESASVASGSTCAAHARACRASKPRSIEPLARAALAPPSKVKRARLMRARSLRERPNRERRCGGRRGRAGERPAGGAGPAARSMAAGTPGSRKNRAGRFHTAALSGARHPFPRRAHAQALCVSLYFP